MCYWPWQLAKSLLRDQIRWVLPGCKITSGKFNKQELRPELLKLRPAHDKTDATRPRYPRVTGPNRSLDTADSDGNYFDDFAECPIPAYDNRSVRNFRLPLTPLQFPKTEEPTRSSQYSITGHSSTFTPPANKLLTLHDRPNAQQQICSIAELRCYNWNGDFERLVGRRAHRTTTYGNITW